MKVTKTLLKQLISEEINRTLEEGDEVPASRLNAAEDKTPETVDKIQVALSSLPDLKSIFAEINTTEELTALIAMILREVDPGFLNKSTEVLTALRAAYHSLESGL